MGIAATAGLGLDYLTQVFNRRQLGRRTPASRPAGAALDQMYDGYEKRVADIGSGRKAREVELKENIPDESFNPYNPVANTEDFAANGTALETGRPLININPNVDEAYLAHELGHVASRHTDVGELVRTLRDNQIKNALIAAAATTFPCCRTRARR